MTMTQDTYEFVRDLVHKESAIVLGPGKEYLVESRLMPLARDRGLTAVNDLISRVRATSDPTEKQHIVEALMTNETSWFRDGAPFTGLVDLLPQLVPNPPTRPLTVWSAACSTGQEPYSLAMALNDRLRQMGSELSIYATDLSQHVLDRARSGRYRELEIKRGLPAALLKRWFTKDGDFWVIDKSLREQVRFDQFNLVAPRPVAYQFDLVLLRNVLIYFDVDTKRKVLDMVRRTMRPGALLILGAAETVLGLDDRWERVPCGTTSAYRFTRD